MSAHVPRLLFIVNSLDLGGAERQVLMLLNGLDTSRVRLSLACLKSGARLLPQLDRARLEEILWCQVRRSVDTAAIRRLRELIVRQGIDAVVCTNRYPMLYGFLASRRLIARPKLVSVFHTTVLRTLKEKAGMLLYRPLFNRCDLLVYVCGNQRAYWRRRGLRPPLDEVLYNGIDVDHFVDRYTAEQKRSVRQACGFETGDYVIGLCSSLRPEKAPEDLVRALARLRGAGVSAKALFIGDGPRRGAVEQTALALGVQAHIRITGMQHDVRPYVACCDVMTLVSRQIETFSLAALEAMALGKPLVMTEIGGAAELIVDGEQGFLCQPGDIDRLSLLLTRLASVALRAQMGEAARQRVRALFRAETMTSGFTGHIERLLRGGAETVQPGARTVERDLRERVRATHDQG